MRSIKTYVNLYRILGFTFRNIRQTIAYSTDSRTSKLPKSRCWGGARSMTGGAGQLIVNMTKTGCYYYIFIFWFIMILIIKSLYRRISNVYENVGVLSRLAYCMTWERARNHFLLFFLLKELRLPSFLDVLSVVSCREWSVTTMNQLTDIRNKSAESLKTKKKINLLYVVHIGAFLY